MASNLFYVPQVKTFNIFERPLAKHPLEHPVHGLLGQPAKQGTAGLGLLLRFLQVLEILVLGGDAGVLGGDGGHPALGPGERRLLLHHRHPPLTLGRDEDHYLNLTISSIAALNYGFLLFFPIHFHLILTDLCFLLRLPNLEPLNEGIDKVDACEFHQSSEDCEEAEDDVHVHSCGVPNLAIDGFSIFKKSHIVIILRCQGWLQYVHNIVVHFRVFVVNNVFKPILVGFHTIIALCTVCHLWFRLATKAEVDYGEDCGGAEGCAGRDLPALLRLDEPEGHPGAEDDQRQRGVDLAW